ncbi:hypothetical protein QQP08_003946 [Theobroma cacao]|nr:hypothetical protein QQP08_003946 [Theobroma cacao]
MKSQHVFVIFMLFILLSPGYEVMGQNEGRVCATPEDLPGCADSSCLNLCLQKYGDKANGLCQANSCLCFHPC